MAGETCAHAPDRANAHAHLLARKASVLSIKWDLFHPSENIMVLWQKFTL